ncbi:MAG: prolipoprotein diacylglyceryl transferase [Candidatus Peribacteraceae bacterium]|nr:prolipoprotein diacylglyceryl transferase [Candidatus Peribacteraceae bacterium]
MINFFPSRQVALSIYHLDIHWYGLLYLLAFLIAYFSLPILNRWRKTKLKHEDFASILTWSVFGVLIGGRLGFVFLYEPVYFSQHPLDIFKVWEGGMSSHGGFAGVVILISFVLWQRNFSILRVADIVVIPAAIGLALGRLGNLINQELYGTVSTLPWAMEFSTAEGLRHPLQIYGIIKDLSIAMICYYYLRRKPFVPGRTFALFLILYGTLRFLLEYIRDQQHSLFDIGFIILTRGQVYTLPILFFGLFLWWKRKDAYEK